MSATFAPRRVRQVSGGDGCLKELEVHLVCKDPVMAQRWAGESRNAIATKQAARSETASLAVQVKALEAIVAALSKDQRAPS